MQVWKAVPVSSSTGMTNYACGIKGRDLLFVITCKVSKDETIKVAYFEAGSGNVGVHFTTEVHRKVRKGAFKLVSSGSMGSVAHTDASEFKKHFKAMYLAPFLAA